MYDTIVHPHALIHGLDEEKIRFAWEHYIAMRYRDAPNEEQILVLGVSQQGELIELVGASSIIGIIIYHAITPPTKKALVELGLEGR